MPRIQKELVQERISGVALRLASHANDSKDDRATWAASLLVTATRDLAPPERAAVNQGVRDLLDMFEVDSTP